MNYGQHGRELLLELKRADGQIPAYNDASVRAALEDLQLHVQAAEEQVRAAGDNKQARQRAAPSISLQHAAIKRNKRCLLAYHMHRMQRIGQLYWESGNNAISSSAAAGSQRNTLELQHLSPQELEFLEKYGDLVSRYTAAACSWDDLRAFLQPTQPSDRVQVRVLDDTAFQGPIVLESGTTVTLSKGSTHYLRWSDVEEYVRKQYLQVLDGEEQT